MFIAALFAVAETRGQPKCPLTEERVRMWTYMESCSAVGIDGMLLLQLRACDWRLSGQSSKRQDRPCTISLNVEPEMNLSMRQACRQACGCQV